MAQASGWAARALALLGLLGVAGLPATAAARDLGALPKLEWSRGEHHLRLGLVTRLRNEWWDARATRTDAFQAIRSRVSLRYDYGSWLTVFAQFQDVRLYSLAPGTSGAGALYRRFSSFPDARTHGDDVRQAYLELHPLEGLALRAGRFDIKLGTEVMYPEPAWKYLKVKRASQRLVGTVGWSHAERSNDGVALSVERNGYHVFAFWARPTTGVFDLEHAYRQQDDIQYGGLSWTIERGKWVPHTELRFFGLGYKDDRSPSRGGLAKAVEIGTVGFSAIGIYPLGPGAADLLLWAAYQWGDFGTLDHSAAAGIVEFGYRFDTLPAKPWLRLGVNIASGDGDPTDGDHGTFFNMLPTNHLYYGFADQLAFQNLVDWIAQLMLKPHPRVGLNLMLHQFGLQDDSDGRYFGTGAFNQQLFGYGMQASGGHTSVGTELDAVATVKVHERLALQAGYSHLWGHTLFRGLPDDDVKFGYVQLSAKY